MHGRGKSANCCTVRGLHGLGSTLWQIVYQLGSRNLPGLFQQLRQAPTAGERAVILVLARDRDQGRVCFAYIAGISRDSATGGDRGQ